MTDDPLAGRLVPGSKRERLWQALWAARTSVVSLPDLYAILKPAPHPQSALSDHVVRLRGALKRTHAPWVLTNIRGCGYVVEGRR